MRYTRYNYKKKGNNDLLKFIGSFILTIIAAGAIGLGLAKVIFNVLEVNNLTPNDSYVQQEENTEQVISDNVESQESEAVSQNNVATSFVLIQCGYFSNKDNANQALNKISTNKASFIVEENSKYRVVAGIYTVDNANSIVDELTKSGIESAKVNFSLKSSDQVQNQIAGICDGYLKVLNTAFNEDVKAVNTTDFKKWVSELEEVKEGDNKDLLKSFKDQIKSLPEEISKEEVAEQMKHLYTVLSNFKAS